MPALTVRVASPASTIVQDMDVLETLCRTSAPTVFSLTALTPFVPSSVLPVPVVPVPVLVPTDDAFYSRMRARVLIAAYEDLYDAYEDIYSYDDDIDEDDDDDGERWMQEKERVCSYFLTAYEDAYEVYSGQLAGVFDTEDSAGDFVVAYEARIL